MQATVREVHRQDKLIVMGDLNARVGRNVEVWKGVIGRQGEVVVNGNGKRLLQFCAEIELVVTNTWFNARIFISSHGNLGKSQRSIIDYFGVRKEMKGQSRCKSSERGTDRQ